MSGNDDFPHLDDDAEAWEDRPPVERMVVDLAGYEGPLDVLLDLARHHKVDLTRIPILALADQYLEFIHKLRLQNLEVAADYLVMAAWLAWLKSRLLLPDETAGADEPTGAEMAAALSFQLQRLEAMREAGQRILALPRLGLDFFARGEPEGVPVVQRAVYEVTLFDLLQAYAGQRRRGHADTLRIAASTLYSVEDALIRLRQLVGRIPDWQTLSEFLPADIGGELGARSALASVFAASLELARSGAAQIRQDRAYGPIWLRHGREGATGDG